MHNADTVLNKAPGQETFCTVSTIVLTSCKEIAGNLRLIPLGQRCKLFKNWMKCFPINFSNVYQFMMPNMS